MTIFGWIYHLGNNVTKPTGSTHPCIPLGRFAKSSTSLIWLG